MKSKHQNQFDLFIMSYDIFYIDVFSSMLTIFSPMKLKTHFTNFFDKFKQSTFWFTVRGNRYARIQSACLSTLGKCNFDLLDLVCNIVCLWKSVFYRDTWQLFFCHWCNCPLVRHPHFYVKYFLCSMKSLLSIELNRIIELI